MGSCCSGHVKYGAFRHELGVPLIDDVKSKLNLDTKVVVVRLAALRDIPVGNSYSGSTDAFVELRLLPDDPIVGNQKQLSSVRPQSISPKWEPPERFQFIVSKMTDSRVILSTYHYNSSNQKDSVVLGDAQIKLKDFASSLSTIASSEREVTKVIKMINSSNGKPAGEIEVVITILSLDEACNVQEHTVYEFQRWNPVHNWGNEESPKHLLPTDPGAWCSEDGKKFGKNMDSIAPPIPPGWEVTKNWRTYGTDFDPEGWQYASVFESPFWSSLNDSRSYVVRRRTWHREVKNIKGLDGTKSNSTEGKSAGRRRRMFSSDKKKQ